jgi:microcystin degradation protein MlrC
LSTRLDGSFAIAGVWQETNTYGPNETTLADFERFELVAGEHVAAAHAGVQSVIGGAMEELGSSVRFGLSAAAWPSGLVTRKAAETLISRFECELQRLGPTQGLVVNLHGAMAAEGVPDVEAELIEAAREVVGDVPIVAVLDFHANPSERLLGSLDGAVAYTTFPHVDMFERGVEAGQLVRVLAQTGRRRGIRFIKKPILTSPLSQGTADGPMNELMRAAAAAPPGVRAFITPGFPYSDVSRAGMSIIVNQLDDDDSKARSFVRLLESTVADHVEEFGIPAVGLATAFERLRGCTGRTMLVDVGDNIGGGSSGESTALLAGLLSLGDRRSILTICSPRLVAAAVDEGVGGMVHVPSGAGSGEHQGLQSSVDFTVERLADGRYQAAGHWMGGRVFEMGPTAVLAREGLRLIATTVATPPFHLEQLTSLGQDPEAFDVLTAKGALAWQDAYRDLVDQTIYVDTPGPTAAFPEDMLRTQSFGADGADWVFPGGTGRR